MVAVEEEVEAVEEVEVNKFLTVCVNCQTTVPSNVLYCWACGNRVDVPKPPPQEEAGPLEEDAQGKAAVEQLGRNDRYECPDCGKVFGPYNNSRGAYIRHRRRVHG